jgi:hypothetical protein
MFALWTASAQAAPALTLSPGTGVFSSSQGMQVVILIEGIAGLGIAGGQVLLDDNDITGLVLSTFTIEGIPGGLSVRSPRQPMGVYGLGTHTFRVNVTLSNGVQIEAGAVWQVLR